MQVTRLDIRHLRRFDDVSLSPAPGLNLLIGDNGAGKTSVIEALHLMAYGRSFRGRVREGLVQAGSPTAALEVFVEWKETGASGRVRRAGMRHSGSEWTGRLDGEPVAQLGELCAALAVVTFEPGSHELVHGGSEVRRRFLDWGLFHVEPAFMRPWRRYARALKQRNILLKQRVRDAQLDAWDAELADTGEELTEQRRRYVDALAAGFAVLAAELAPSLGVASLAYLPGWKRDELPLADALLLARDRDLLAGHTSVGPHRADWRPSFAAIPGRDALSRGQAKLAALAALLAQADFHAEVTGQQPVFALDDLASELDRHHQRRVLQRLVERGSQVFVSGTELPAAIVELGLAPKLFHVEHGRISSV
ncbi:DNA replication/repair protein RecF [Cognatilysobacter lacus]|uniref:DNA replication and repair protein RecF n=1 Tax=Cognatilysobacter lacus TaxID=1643323 RepID=A0A5D8Z7L8_9GAMM|nr:DNA replication/repair protein RecF [Lysobacter lacus]TZF90888.1 DNA replication/repair protein RecF [Lysobacter lacus]